MTAWDCRHLPYQELYECKSCAKFLADFFNYDACWNSCQEVLEGFPRMGEAEKDQNLNTRGPVSSKSI